MISFGSTLNLLVSFSRVSNKAFFRNFLSISTPSKLYFRPKYFTVPNPYSGFTFFRHHFHRQSYSEMSSPSILADLEFNLTPQDFHNRADSLINECRALCDKVARVPDSDVSFDTVLKDLNEVACLMGSKKYFLDSSQHFAPDAEIRKASTESDKKLREFSVELRMRKDVFDKLLVLQKKGEPLKPEAKRFLDVLLLQGKRNGLHLDETTRERVKTINTKIEKLGVDFMKNLNDVTTVLHFSKEELKGVPDDFFESLKKDADTGKFEITLKYPHYFPIMEKCSVPETRKSLEFAFNTQCLEENDRILTELRKLRHECAVVLGYPNHATYITEKLMSKSADNVSKFLSELAEKMSPLWKEEKKFLLELKEKECEKLGIPYDGKLNAWDTLYYSTRCKEVKYAVDTTKLREYFPFPVVKEGLLNIYQDLLGLKFQKEDRKTWHEDVELYSVTESDTGTLLGYFYLDLFPRPNKYGHAALFELQNTYLRSDGQREVAVGVMIANFTKPKPNVPALLDHSEVVTFFHEFGHVMHYICMKPEFAHFGIMNMERDFIEAPSQMLENWCWEKAPLKKLSSHYLNKTPIPENDLSALIKSRLANVGYSNLRQIILASYDQRIHSSPEGSTKELYYELIRKIVGLEPQEGTNFACHFGHLANEYDAQYYGYLWSEVFSMDMFQTRFGEKNVLNPEVGRDYKDKILAPGGTKDAHDLICSFLGREPSQEAFLRSKGLKV